MAIPELPKRYDSDYKIAYSNLPALPTDATNLCLKSYELEGHENFENDLKD